MKFIHTSDWHIGRQFHGVSLLDDQAHVLDQLVDIIKKEQPNALVIAGDIYDRAVPPASAVKMLDAYLTKICIDCATPIIIISGNHDNAQRLGFASEALTRAGLHILSDIENVEKPVVISSADDSETIDFYGIPFHTPEAVRSAFSETLKQCGTQITSYDDAHTYLAEKINAKKNSAHTNVLISHCFIDGAAESDSERPLAVGGSDRVSYQPLESFNYVALGHLHAPQFRGADHIRYSGSLLKYSFSERHQKKGINLVSISAGKLESIVHIPLASLRDVRVLEGSLEEVVKGGIGDSAREDYVLARLTDTTALLEPMAKLREVYPNILQLEKTGLFNAGGENIATTLGEANNKRNEIDMFADFYTHITGEPFPEDLKKPVENVVVAAKEMDE